MADEAKVGTPWQPAELDEIVADYMAMLIAELSGQRYSKAAHSKALMARIGRTHRSVEFKHQNISAVLDELGLPWIKGYVPQRHYQGAIFDAIERYLTGSPAILDRTPAAALLSRRLRTSLCRLQCWNRRPIFRGVFVSWSASSTRLNETTETRALGSAGEGLWLIWSEGA